MKVKHNKKRNVGLLFAQLSQLVSESLVNGKIQEAKKVLRIMKKHFAPGSELFREFRLFRAMMVTSVPADSLASSIISEAKVASKRIDSKLLTQQKSALIKDINYKLAESNFYNRRVGDYKTYATIQTLLSEWRSGEPDIMVVSRFETELHGHLLKEKGLDELSELKTENVNHLVVNIMHSKIEEKFAASLSDEQLDLLREYIFANGDSDRVQNKLCEVKDITLNALTKFNSSCENKILVGQINEVKERMSSLDSSKVDDDSISKYLTLMKLKDELTSGE